LESESASNQLVALLTSPIDIEWKDRIPSQPKPFVLNHTHHRTLGCARLAVQGEAKQWQQLK
jgi:hypothetical protein